MQKLLAQPCQRIRGREHDGSPCASGARHLCRDHALGCSGKRDGRGASADCQSLARKSFLLGGSWLVISRATVVITHIRGLITPLITTHEPPSTFKTTGSLEESSMVRSLWKARTPSNPKTALEPKALTPDIYQKSRRLLFLKPLNT